MKPLHLLVLLVIMSIPFKSVCQSIIEGNDHVVVNESSIYTHELGDGGPDSLYHWVATGGNIINSSETELEVSWDDDGEYSVELWLFTSSDEQVDENMITVYYPEIRFSYDSYGNRISRELIYYSENSRKSTVDDKLLHVENEDIDVFLVYPNPTTHSVNVILPEEAFLNGCMIHLYTISGQILYQSESFERMNSLDMDRLSPGSYILKVFYNEKSKEWQIIKQ